MFGKRGNLPPSSFSANTLTPNSQTNGNNRRFSGIDFEEALLKDTTFRFNESVDVNQLGVGLDNSFDSLGTPTKGPPPGMNIVPPTPSPNGKRVSVYRQTGFASSPDLASLLKSKKQPAPPLPTSSSPSGSPRKGTIRTKTSGFLGKFLNHGSVRERSKTDATHPSIDSLSSVPPVPPIPRTMTTSPSPGSTSPIADAFSRFPESKPLPPIMLSPVARDEDDDSSIVMVSRPSRSPSPAAGASSTSKANKRRSMSAGDTDWKAVIASSSSAVSPTLPSVPDERKERLQPRRRLLSDLQGELNAFDSGKSPTLDLHDPSTPGKRRYARSPADSPVLSSKSADKPELRTHSSSPTPKLSVQTDSDSPSGSPIIPARSSSLNSSPTRTVHRPASQGSLGVTTGNSTVRPKGGPRSSIQGPRDLNRLRVLHRSAASNSEPSLVSKGDDGPGSSNHSGSQQDLSSSQSNLTTLPSSSSSQSLVRSDDGDLDSQGKEYATRCFNEDEDFKAKEKIAEWLGGEKALNQAALQYYMEFFDFTGLRLDMAFRRLCAKLYLKAETQQVDRILEQFSRRYWKCNPASLYGSSNIVHAVSYSMLLLNTDLHVADVANRMTRREFVNNTLSAIQEQLRAPQRERTTSMSSLGHKMAPTPPSRGSGSGSNNTSMENVATITARTHRSDSVNSWTSVSREVPLSSSPVAISQATFTPGHHSNGSNVSMQASASGHGGETRSSTGPQYGRAWETDMEGVLKEMYNAIKSQQILQPLGSGPARLSTSSLSPGGSTIRRNQSLRGPPDRLATLKRGSIRGIQSILGQQQGSSPYSSNSSIEGRVSPSPSFAASTHEALYGSSSSFLTPTLGFASNLSHTIIRETQEDHDDDLGSEESAGSDSTTISISDEELALLGAPWAKEGMLCRKQYWEASGKRAKDKTWLDVFVVIQKGELNMFTFGDHGSGGRSMFGGGNWLANADAVGTVHLAHSLAHALPPPGYNRQRPYCMVLTLANGGVYFFQAGTEELVNEWVSTCNYWAARTSKEPLAGGVSNMEYGWNRVSDPMHGRSQSDSGDATSVTDDFSDAMSVKSGRSSKSKYGWRDGAATVRGSSSPYSDRVFINDWKPPMHPTVSSMHDEETQMEALQKHVATMKKDIKRHNELREPMLAMYQPRSSNCVKAQSNWEKKSRFLLAEIVKYDSYVESLKAAMSLRLKKRGEKALERALRGTSPAADESAAPWKGKGVDADDDDADLNEPTTPAATVQSHRRHPADDS